MPLYVLYSFIVPTSFRNYVTLEMSARFLQPNVRLEAQFSGISGLLLFNLFCAR